MLVVTPEVAALARMAATGATTQAIRLAPLVGIITPVRTATPSVTDVPWVTLATVTPPPS
jgi:hypothetical protein